MSELDPRYRANSPALINRGYEEAFNLVLPVNANYPSNKLELTMIRCPSLFLIFVAAVVSLLFVPHQDESKPVRDDKITLPAQDQDAISRRDFMRTKLMYSQVILEGLTTGDFDLIKTAIHEVQQVTEGEMWVTIDDDRYRKLTEEFKTATGRMMKAAESGNIEATAMRFYQFSTSCIDCHKHIRLAKYDL